MNTEQKIFEEKFEKMDEASKGFYRIDTKKLENLLFSHKETVNNALNTVYKGNDLPMDRIDSLIDALQKVKKEAKKNTK